MHSLDRLLRTLFNSHCVSETGLVATNTQSLRQSKRFELPSPDDGELDWSKSRNSDCASTSRRQVDYPRPYERTSVCDADNDLLAISLVDDGDPGSEWQRSVCRCQGARIQPPAVGGPASSVTITIPVH
jgi:hypothetical protein